MVATVINIFGFAFPFFQPFFSLFFCFACHAAYEVESECVCGSVCVCGSHVCGKPCKQRFKMIKCFSGRTCVASSTLSCRLVLAAVAAVLVLLLLLC